jgi:mannitol-1-phosphate 5-dehydrogenase
MKKLVQWGAGNIGRSFIGQIFARNGWHVTFVDVDTRLVQALSESNSYRVITVWGDKSETLLVKGIDAIHADDTGRVKSAVFEADCISFSVGKNILPKILPDIARLIAARYRAHPEHPVDILIAENVQNGASIFRDLLKPHLPDNFPFTTYIGLVETSLGKMVPIQSGGDPLTLYAEPYNTLILDRLGFIGSVPEFPEVEAVAPIGAWVAKKLYIHNLGHAVAAYIGYRHDPAIEYIWQALEIPRIAQDVKLAMIQASALLRAEFPGIFSAQDIQEHIDDLLNRFANRALGDTLHRVGRDLARKLRWDDRLAGAILVARRHHLPCTAIAEAYRAGMQFLAPDASGHPYQPDADLLASLTGLPPRDRIRILLDYPIAPDRRGPDDIEALIDTLVQGLD